MIRKYLYIFFLCILNFPFLVLGQNHNQFAKLTTEDGLSSVSVFSISQDYQGFMWFGTRDGLNKYDGNSFTIYRNDPSDKFSISGNYIRTTLEDSNRNFWVGTSNGLCLYDREKDAFIRVKRDSLNLQNQNELGILSLAEDNQGNLWVGSGVGLYQIPRDNFRKLIHFNELVRNGEKKPENIAINHIFTEKNGFIWIGSSQGLYRINLDAFGKYKVRKYPISQEPGNEKPDHLNQISSIVRDAKGRLIVTTRGGYGVNVLNEKTGIFRHYINHPNDLQIKNTDFRTVFLDKDGVLWLGSFKGLSYYDEASAKLVTFNHHPDLPHSLGDNSVRPIYQDNKGSIWIGTYFGGISLLDQHQFRFKNYQPPAYSNSISYSAVSGMEEDNKGNIWIGTEGGGLNYFNPDAETFKLFSKAKNNLNHDNIKDLCYDSRGNLWVGMYNGGINLRRKGSENFENFILDSSANIAEKRDVYTIEEDLEGKIWFGTMSGELFSYDYQENQLVKHPKNFPPIRKIISDKKGNIWVGSKNNLWFKSINSNQWDLILGKANDLNFEIYSLLEDTEDNIWIGTFGGGMIRYNPGTKSCKHFTTKEGLLGNSVFGILEDDSRNLWISTDKGISKFSNKDSLFHHFDNRDGLPKDFFNYNAYLKSGKGEMYFGSVNGFTRFFPDSIQLNDFVSPIIITGLRLFNQPVKIGGEDGILNQNISLSRELVFNYQQNIFTLEFANLNFILPQKNTYAYKLKGLESEWNYVSTPFATYTNLSPGTYTFMVKGANNDGIWNEKPTELRIKILPPPWKTWWAFSIYIILMTFGLYMLVRFTKIKARLQHQLELESINQARQEEIHQEKLRFFTNISHEFRTPLTLISGPLENLFRQKTGDKGIQKDLLLIKKNTDRLLRMVNQLLEFRRYETGNMNLKVAEGNLVKFTKEIVLAFGQLAEEKEIELSFIPAQPEIKVYFDRDQMEKVWFNLLSNAIKFTPEGGKIQVVLKMNDGYADLPKGGIIAMVENTGVPIPSGDLRRIFERFYQSDKQHTGKGGSGIGLALSKSIVQGHGGEILAESFAESGEMGKNRFIFQLPLGREHFTATQIISNFKDSESNVHYAFGKVPLNGEISPAKPQEPAGFKKEAPLVLVVEDNTDVRDFIKSILANDYQIIEADSGVTGLKKAKSSIPDLIVSDVMMPEMDGIEFCKQIKNDISTCHIPVILLTARTSLIYKVQGFENGADDYVTKPFSMELLSTRVANLIASRKMLRQKFSREVVLQPTNIAITPPDEVFLEKALKIIEENMANENFNVAEFSKEMGMSRPVLYRKIKALTDLSIIDFIKSVRLKKAALLLGQKELSITDIAIKTGFSDARYFRKCFKAEFGVSPSSFRETDTMNIK
ncbi:hybrid sensor histidine kinase/response regulator transcription factor [Flexithrix dorotheae]|uniref:hybrid sensor histidine kinase/response regulator transcription factor n=1 Tax=Flexithrix dorotheae TaxID=70993 RepID=UPI00037629BE|nr:hybrid sensor histidine kinase/response regulator transcription factor [Flexithrix dorotheae]